MVVFVCMKWTTGCLDFLVLFSSVRFWLFGVSGVFVKYAWEAGRLGGWEDGRMGGGRERGKGREGVKGGVEWSGVEWSGDDDNNNNLHFTPPSQLFSHREEGVDGGWNRSW